MRTKVVAAVTALNTVALLGVLLSGTLGEGPAGPEALPQPQDSARIAELERRIAALEAKGPAELAPALASPAAAPAAVVPGAPSPPDPQPAQAPAGAAQPAGASDDGPVTRAQVRDIVGEVLQQWNQDRIEAEQRRAEASKKPRKTLRRISEELALSAQQEADIRQLYAQLSRDSMRVLFELPQETNFEAIKTQLAQAEHDPELKERLREQVAYNWTRRQSEVWALFVKLDARLRKVLDQETLQDFYKYDVRLADPEFPDIQKMFFQGEGGDR